MAICLPGRESRANLAATSATRVEPLVMTMAWTAMMTMKMMKPTTRPSVPPEPTTKLEKARIMRPSNLAPLVRISLSEETFSESPKMVDTRSRVGKIANSVGFPI